MRKRSPLQNGETISPAGSSSPSRTETLRKFPAEIQSGLWIRVAPCLLTLAPCTQREAEGRGVPSEFSLF